VTYNKRDGSIQYFFLFYSSVSRSRVESIEISLGGMYFTTKDIIFDGSQLTRQQSALSWPAQVSPTTVISCFFTSLPAV